MKWVTWDQAAISALICGVTALLLRKLPQTRSRVFIIAACTELALISFLYTLWRLAMVLPLDKPDGAIARGRSIDTLQHLSLIHI